MEQQVNETETTAQASQEPVTEAAPAEAETTNESTEITLGDLESHLAEQDTPPEKTGDSEGNSTEEAEPEVKESPDETETQPDLSEEDAHVLSRLQVHESDRRAILSLPQGQREAVLRAMHGAQHRLDVAYSTPSEGRKAQDKARVDQAASAELQGDRGDDLAEKILPTILPKAEVLRQLEADNELAEGTLAKLSREMASGVARVLAGTVRQQQLIERTSAAETIRQVETSVKADLAKKYGLDDQSWDKLASDPVNRATVVALCQHQGLPFRDALHRVMEDRAKLNPRQQPKTKKAAESLRGAAESPRFDRKPTGAMKRAFPQTDDEIYEALQEMQR